MFEWNRKFALFVLLAVAGCSPNGKVEWQKLSALALTPAQVAGMAHNASLTISASGGNGFYSFALTGPGKLTSEGARAVFTSTPSGLAETSTVTVTAGEDQTILTIPVQASGTLDTSFGDVNGSIRKGYTLLQLCVGCVDIAKAMTFDENSNILVAAYSGGGPAGKFASFNLRAEDGTLNSPITMITPATDLALTPGTSDSPEMVQLQNDDGPKYVIGGKLVGASRTIFYRLKPDGTRDNSWGGANGYLNLVPDFNAAGAIVHPQNQFLAVTAAGAGAPGTSYRTNTYHPHDGLLAGTFDLISAAMPGLARLVPLSNERAMLVGKMKIRRRSSLRSPSAATSPPTQRS